MTSMTYSQVNGPSHPGELSLQRFGTDICPSRSPDGSVCPAWCSLTALQPRSSEVSKSQAQDPLWTTRASVAPPCSCLFTARVLMLAPPSSNSHHAQCLATLRSQCSRNLGASFSLTLGPAEAGSSKSGHNPCRAGGVCPCPGWPPAPAAGSGEKAADHL